MNSTEPAEYPPPVVLLTKQAVFCGDHGQDITRAIEVLPGETIDSLARRTLTSAGWNADKSRTVEPDWYLIIRMPEVSA